MTRLFCFIICFCPLLVMAGENEWTYVGLYPERITDIVVHQNDPTILYVSALDVFWDSTREGGIFKTMDHGLTWDTIGFRNYNVMDLAFDPQHPETLWAACDIDGAFRSTDGGVTWERRSEGLFLGGPDGLGVTSIAVNLFNSDLLMCTGAGPANGGWLARTTNGGELWTEPDVLNDPFFKVIFDSLCPGRIFALGDFPFLWVSDDSGATFRHIDLPPYALVDIALDPFRRDWLWGIQRLSFFYSPDAGSTWVEPDTSFPPDPELGLFVRVSRDRMNTVYTTGYGSVFQTKDCGVTWYELVEGWPTHAPAIATISVVGEATDELWTGLISHGILSYTVTDTSNLDESFSIYALDDNLKIYPNPASIVLYISSNSGSLSGTFFLYNILGQKVISVPLSHLNGVQAVTIPHSLPSGTYFASFISVEQSGNLPIKNCPVIVVK